MRAGVIVLILVAATAWLAAAELRVEGISAAEWNRLRERMAGRLAAVTERPATPWRASDAAFLVRSQMLAEGYDGVRVTWSIPEGSNSIVLQVSEGKRLLLGEVEVQGIEGEAERKRLAELVALPARERSGSGSNIPYVARLIPEGVGLARMHLVSRGHWEAEVTAAEPRVDRQAGKVDLTVRVVAGPRHTIAAPDLHGELAGAGDQLRDRLADLVGKVATTENLNAMRKRVEVWYAGHGFTFAEVSFSAQPDKGAILRPSFEIEAGPRYRTGEVRISGLERTRTSAVAGFYQSLKGKPFDAEEFDAVDKSLLQTGAFRDIERTLIPREDGRADVEMSFTEQRARGVSLTVGAGSYEGFILGMGYFNRNVTGRLWTQAFNFEYTSRGLLGEARFTDPLFLGTRMSLNGRLFAFTRSNEGYSVARGGAELFVERRIGESQSLRLGWAGARVSAEEDGLPPELLGPQDYTDGRVFARYAFDRRDNALAPKDGFYFGADLSAGSILDGESIPYTRGAIDASLYKTLAEKNTFVLRGSTGWIESGGKDMPIDERFFLGGADTVRSFPQRRLGPRAGPGNDSLGGQMYWQGSAEYLRTVAGPLRLVGFVDAGSLGEEDDGPGGGDVELAAGAGLRLDLPIGPMRFEYGHNLSRDENEPSGAFHFAIGVSF